MGSTQLWVGEHNELIEKVYDYAIALFGEKKAPAIRDRQFYGVMWLAPEKNLYVRSQLEPLFERTALALSDSEQCVVVFEQADLLSPACANSLLKLLEEPSPGYHFILLTAHREGVAPTLQSRSLITEYFSAERPELYGQFLSYFKEPTPAHQLQVVQELEKIKMSESQARTSIDDLYQYWASRYKSGLKEGNAVVARKADRMMRICLHAIEHPPMPGSVKLFWKNVYLLMTL